MHVQVFIVAFPAPNFFEVIHGHVWCRPPPPSPCKIKFLNIIELPKIYMPHTSLANSNNHNPPPEKFSRSMHDGNQ